MKLGIALSGGSLRGAAHIGVLDVLYEAGIRPDMIAGASAGSVVASLFAHGIHPKNIAKIAQSFPGRRLVDWTTSIWDALLFGQCAAVLVRDAQQFQQSAPARLHPRAEL